MADSFIKKSFFLFHRQIDPIVSLIFLIVALLIIFLISALLISAYMKIYSQVPKLPPDISSF